MQRGGGKIQGSATQNLYENGMNHKNACLNREDVIELVTDKTDV